MRATLLELLAVIEVAIDFPEDGGDIIDVAALGQRLAAEVGSPLLELLARARHGRIFREGANVVIYGRPNVGKSSLLNALLGEERAIVTAMIGTTRDTIEECLNIHGMPLRLIDTAGIRETTETVEEIGVERSRHRVAAADLVLLLVEAGAPVTPEDLALNAGVAEKKVLVVVNKLDLLPGAETGVQVLTVDQALAKWTAHFPGRPLVGVSARTGRGLRALEDAIFRAISGGEPPKPTHDAVHDFTGNPAPDPAGDPAHDPARNPARNLACDPDYACVPNARHAAALVKASAAIQRLAAGFAADLAPELLAIELQDGLSHLDEIIGETSNEDLLDSIFSRFCLGK